ncbi:ImmA/IrrE family metallo-endopeptidase [Komagataeibacter europaeus]|nr:ImmA/IrrE family metallo-endopeptidase [Komagataeibacter europaeus]
MINVATITPFDIAKCYMKKAPTDLMGMASALGIRVDNNATFEDKNLSGSIKRCRDGSYQIAINGSDSEQRKRFTLAHELAHFMLHRDIIDSVGLVDDAMYRSGASATEEYQANSLAAELLMPKDLVRLFWKKGLCGIYQLGGAFDASPDAVKIRLRQLGLSP